MSRFSLRTLEDLRQRSRIDATTGCWNVDAAVSSNGPIVWLPALMMTVTLTRAMAWLITGQAPPAGKFWYARCGNRCCGNPGHRSCGARSEMQRALRPRLDPLHRARITQAMRRLPRCRYSPQLKAEIMASAEPASVIGPRVELSPSLVSLIRRGRAWRDQMPAASVFTLAAALHIEGGR